MPGDSYTLEKEITCELVQSFAQLSGDYNPAHMDDKYCQEHGSSFRTAHGLLSTAFISCIIGMHLPGEGSICLSHSFDFIAPVKIGDTIKITGKIIKKDNDNALRQNIIVLKFEVYNQTGTLVIRGTSRVLLKSF
jgi:3-hydroxybutyryl-CoA dehydratase